MNDDDNDVSELVERLSDVIQESHDFARVADGYDSCQARRNMPLDATGLEIDRLKDPYALEPTTIFLNGGSSRRQSTR